MVGQSVPRPHEPSANSRSTRPALLSAKIVRLFSFQKVFSIMTRILALSGSLRTASFNTALARAAAELAPAGTTIDVATLRGVPLYDGDDEAQNGIPPAVAALKDQILAADGLLLVTPDYNSGVPGVLKNGIDWLSRTDLKAVFGQRPTGLIGAAAGGFGTLPAQTAWLPILKALGAQVYSGGSLMLPSAHNAFNEQGQLINEKTRQNLIDFLAGFAAFVQSHKR